MAVIRADGTIITAADDIAQKFVDYNTSLLGTEAHTIPVNDGVFDWGPKLSSELTEELLGDQVCRAVLDFFRSGRMLRQLNHTIIALVPKSEHSTYVADYRPILCCNVIYKAITKIISDRLAPALEHLIDRCQAAFVGGRNITDNIFLPKKWYDSTRGNGFHLDILSTSTSAN
ncbi:UNVERIFIED_CONTAM: hypothetical protein Sindi_2952100 [Sesamum indicum]